MELVSLEEISSGGLFKDGDWIESKDQDSNGNIRLLQLADIGVGNFIDKSSKFVNEDTFKRLKCTEILNGDILIARMPDPIGRACLFDVERNNNEKYITAVDVAILRVNENISNKYVSYLLISPQLLSESLKQSTGATRKRISRKKLAKFKIPLPPLPTQKKIASILDEADTLRQLNKQLIKKYDALTQSLFLEMFGDPVANPMGWEKVRFDKLCSFEKQSVKPENINSGTYYIGLESIQKETGKIADKVKVESNELKSNKFYFNQDYILYGKLRPYLNKVGNPDFEGVCSTDIIPLKPLGEKSNKSFITSIMRSPGFVSWANERCSGANLPRISPKEVQKYLIINPPIQLQNQFAERVAIIEKQKAQAHQSLQKSEDLFNSLLQKAFKGELVK